MLSVGNTFPTVTALARYLGENPCQGNAKLHQLSHWRRFFLWEKEGTRGVRITQILRPYEPKTVKPRWRGELAPLLEHYLYLAAQGIGPNKESKRQCALVLSTTELYELLGLQNKHMRTLAQGKLLLEESVEMQRTVWHQIRELFRGLTKRTLECYPSTRSYMLLRKGTWALCPPNLQEACAQLYIDAAQELGVKSRKEIILANREVAYYSLITKLAQQRELAEALFEVRIFDNNVGRQLPQQEVLESRHINNERAYYYLSAKIEERILSIVISLER